MQLTYTCIRFIYLFSEYTVAIQYEKNNSYTFFIDDKKFLVSGGTLEVDPSIIQCTINKKSFQVRAVENDGVVHLFTKV